MKLSEMGTDQALDCVSEIAPVIARICEDEAIVREIKKLSENKKNTAMINMIGSMCGQLVPLVVRYHRDDLYIIVCAMTQKSPEEVKKQSLIATMNDVRGFVDKDFIDFFTSSAAMA